MEINIVIDFLLVVPLFFLEIIVKGVFRPIFRLGVAIFKKKEETDSVEEINDDWSDIMHDMEKSIKNEEDKEEEDEEK